MTKGKYHFKTIHNGDKIERQMNQALEFVRQAKKNN